MSPISIEQEILRRKVSLLFRNAKPAQAVSIFNALVLGYINAPNLGLAIEVWVAVALITAGYRIFLAHRYQRCAAQQTLFEQLDSDNWLHHARLGAGIAGAVWAAGGILCILGNQPTLQFFDAFVMAGMVAGAVPVLSADRLAFRLYAWPIVLAVALSCLNADPLHLAFSAMSVVFLIMVTRSADYINDTLSDAIRLEVKHGEVVEDLRVSNAAIAQAARNRHEFLANISHELRTPMNGVLGMTQLLELTELNAEQADYLVTLKQSGDNLMHQIERLIELASLEAKAQLQQPEMFSTLSYLSDAVNHFHSGAKAKGLTVKALPDPNMPPTLFGDHAALSRVLHLLLENAIKFTREGEISVSSRLVSTLGPKAILEFEVRDTGIGIPIDKQMSIFEAFTQGDGTATRSYAGVGIGLTIAKRLVENLGGQITVQSEVTQGTCFRVRVPFEIPAQAHPAQE